MELGLQFPDVFGEPICLRHQPSWLLPQGQVVPLYEGDSDASAHRGCFQALLHLLVFSKDHFGGNRNNTALSSVLDHLGIPELRRGPEFRFTRTSSFPWPLWDLLSDTIHPKEDVSLVAQLIARKERNRPIGHTVYLLH